LAHHDADREEHRGEHGQQHDETMAYQSVELLSGHGHHTEQEQHIRRHSARRRPGLRMVSKGFDAVRVGIDST
jgi:hypothetical protein